MSRLSPQERANAERGRHRRTNAILVAAIAVVAVGVWILRDSSMALPTLPDDSKREQQDSVTVVPDEPETDPVAGNAHWHQRIAAIKNGTPRNEFTETVHVKVDQLGQSLTDKHASLSLESSAARKIIHELATLEEVVASMDSVPTLASGDMESRLESAFDALQRAKKARQEEVTERAVLVERDELEPKIRKTQLELRDQQDRAATLRHQIAKVDREQTVLREKASRAEALRLDMADVRKYLGPFTAPGHLQPHGTGNAWDTRRTANAEPVSLSKLERLGALEPTMKGLELLFIFGGGKNAIVRNDRPLGSFPEYASSYLHRPEVLAAVKRSQQLLREHGQALIEARMLSP